MLLFIQNFDKIRKQEISKKNIKITFCDIQ